VRRNHQCGRDLELFGARCTRLAPHAQDEATRSADDRLQRARLQSHRARRRGGIGERGVEMLTAERPAPPMPSLGGRQRRDDRFGAAHQGDATELGAGKRIERSTDADRIEQR
jgi:hypothetical protein